MPAPSAATLFAGIDAKLVAPFQSPRHASFVTFLTDLTNSLASEWAAWQNGITGGGNDVSGEGIGTWVGTGDGGTLAEGHALVISVTTYPAPAFQQFINALKTVITNKFSLWASTFVFSTVDYVGTSTATPIAAGTFEATNTPAPIGTLGSGTNPAGIKSAVEAMLTAPFDISHPLSALPILNQAIEDTIIEEFTIWLSSSPFSGDTVSGTAAAGTGAGSGTSDGNGTIA